MIEYRKLACTLLMGVAMPLAAYAQAPAPAKPAAPPATQPATQPAATEDEKATPPAKRRTGAGRRDPFMSIIRNAGNDGPPCTASGKKCLYPERVVLRGIVISNDDAIAVVENSEKKTYMLRAGDLLLNGEVARITEDSLVMRQRVSDRLGRVSTREVVKRLARSNMFPEGVSGFRTPSKGSGEASQEAGGGGSTAPGLLGIPF